MRGRKLKEMNEGRCRGLLDLATCGFRTQAHLRIKRAGGQATGSDDPPAHLLQPVGGTTLGPAIPPGQLLPSGEKRIPLNKSLGEPSVTGIRSCQ